MARARNIKPSFFQNEDLGELCPLARLFFIGLWTVADYKGCVEFRPKRLKVQLLPYDECDTELLAKNLEHSGHVAIYSVKGQRYIKVINFEKHQNPHKNERQMGSDIPDICDADAQPVDFADVEKNREENGTTREQNGTAPADSLLLIPDSPIPQPDSLTPQTDSLKLKNVAQSARREQVAAVFDHWRITMDHPRSVLDDKRRRLIEARMKDGYSTDDLKAAITGCSRSPFHMGQNEQGTRYDGLELILRDGSKVDKFLATYRTPPRPLGRQGLVEARNQAAVDEFLAGDAPCGQGPIIDVEAYHA